MLHPSAQFTHLRLRVRPANLPSWSLLTSKRRLPMATKTLIISRACGDGLHLRLSLSNENEQGCSQLPQPSNEVPIVPTHDEPRSSVKRPSCKSAVQANNSADPTQVWRPVKRILFDLARALARQAAREDYTAEQESRGTSGSKPSSALRLRRLDC
jgi:hypothetical protein